MKKIMFGLLLFCFTSLHANLHHTMIEAKASYFLFQQKHVRELYKTGGFMPSIEIDSRIYKSTHWFLETAFLYKKGFSLETNSDLKLYLLPISLGFKQYFLECHPFKLYIKASPNWVWVKEKDTYPGFKPSVTKNTWGGTFGIGTVYYPMKHMILDFFINYLLDPLTIKNNVSGISNKVYLGGFQFGLGLGCKW